MARGRELKAGKWMSVRPIPSCPDPVVDLEVALAESYQACSGGVSRGQKLLAFIRNQEELHARFIRGLAELISLHPRDFRFGRAFNSAAIKSALSSVASYTDTVRKRAAMTQASASHSRDEPGAGSQRGAVH